MKTINFQCPNCGASIHAPLQAAGRAASCKKCNYRLRIPSTPELPKAACNSVVAPGPAFTMTSSSYEYQANDRDRASLALESVSLGTILLGMVVVWVIVFSLAVLVAAVSMVKAAVLAILAFLITLLFAASAVHLMRAKRRALRFGESYLFGGLLGIVAWDPNQGVLFLKDKRIGPIDSDAADGGGVMLILPWLGEELAFRAPLEVRTTKFEDKEVLTREYVPLMIKGAIYWRIVDLERFYLSVSRSIHQVDDRGGHQTASGYDSADAVETQSIRAARQLEAGEEWLRLIAEEQTRAEVLQARTGLLVADRVVDGLPAEMQSLLTTDDYHRATDGLAEGIRKRIESLCTKYGIFVERVSLQEVQLAAEIRAAAISACVSAYKPLIAQRDATAAKLTGEAAAYSRKRLLEGEAEVIGGEAVAKREVLGSVQPFAFGGRNGSIIDLLEHFFSNFTAADSEAPLRIETRKGHQRRGGKRPEDMSLEELEEWARRKKKNLDRPLSEMTEEEKDEQARRWRKDEE